MTKENHPFRYQAGHTLSFGVTLVPEGVQFAIYLPDQKECRLKLYKKGQKKPVSVVELTDKYKMGSSYFVIVDKAENSTDTREIADILTQDYEYMYEADGQEFIDPYADCIYGREQWGKRSAGRKERGGICLESFEWEEDTPLRISYSDLILYQLHVRGYTRHASSKVAHKGTFQGLVEKIPYMQDLGINGVLMLPVYDFNEIQVPGEPEENGVPAVEQKLNFWGYGTRETYYFAPKFSYAGTKESPSMEFRRMVKAFHAAGIEVLLDIYFSPGTNLFMMTDCLRSWVIKYHVDGFRVNQEVMPSLSMASDPILSGVKILGNYWDMNLLHGAMLPNQKNALAEYNEGFMNDARRFLKSDEGMVPKMAKYLVRNSTEHSYVHFITHVNGFTLMDLVSYDVKHNEKNGEMNQDGTEYNYSWNCGVEGKTRKKAIMDRRMVQIRNAFLMLMAGQATPMILAGDELGNSQEGNNNAYCQDNATTWISWTPTKTSQLIHDYVKKLIAFRKCFRILHREEPVFMMDSLSCGMPDVSVHGTQAWRPDYYNYSRMLGMLYYGDYAHKTEGRSVYIIYNMYWEAKSFDLPNLPMGRSWKVMIDTYDNRFEDSLLYEKRKKVRKRKTKKIRAELQKKTVVAPRSIVVFVEE